MVEGVYTNTMANGAYRGAGRPEAAFYLERLMDMVADEGGLDPAEVRRVNFIPPDEFPYTTLSGEQLRHRRVRESRSTRRSELVGYDELRAEQAELRKQGRYLGIGAGVVRRDLRLRPVGELDRPRRAGRRGHDLHRHLAARPGAGDDLRPARRRLHRRRFRQGRSSTTATPATPRTATAPMGSRGLAVGGAALVLSLDKIREKAKRDRRAHARSRGRGHRAGRRQIPGQGRARPSGSTLAEIAAKAYGGDLPEDIDAGLETTDFFKPAGRDLPLRLAHRGGRGLPGDRRGQAAALRLGRRLRQHHQPECW